MKAYRINWLMTWMKAQSNYAVRIIPILAISAITPFLGGNAEAALLLTSAGSSSGFSLSTFADNFPSINGVGPLGIAFSTSGGVLVTDAPGNVRLFPTDTDGQHANLIPAIQNYGINNAVGLAQVGSKIYMTQQGSGSVVQLNTDGTFNQVILSGITNATGIVANPVNGHLFVSQIDSNGVVQVDPLAKTSSLLNSGITLDGLSISADGSTLYAAATAMGHILGFNTSNGAQVFDSGFISGGVDGTALGSGSLAGNIYVNTNSGTVVGVNLNTLTQTLIATGGSRGDFVTVDPKNCSLLLTQTDQIDRLIPGTGGCFGSNPNPTPSSIPESSPIFGLVAMTALGIGAGVKRKL